MVHVVSLAQGAGVEEAVHSALVAGHPTVLGPAWRGEHYIIVI